MAQQEEVGNASIPILKGRVKWFNNAKGYGFINQDGETEDIFLYYSKILLEGYKTIATGSRVEFQISNTRKEGLRAAVNVRYIPSSQKGTAAINVSSSIDSTIPSEETDDIVAVDETYYAAAFWAE